MLGNVPETTGGRGRGFTLIEMMVTVAVLAITVTVAVPSFQRLIESNRVSTQANSLIASFALARSEAVKRGVAVSVTATGGDFDNGWCVHTGADCDDEDDVIRTYEAPDALALDTTHTQISFDSRGIRSAPAVADGAVEIGVEPAQCAAGEAELRRLVEVALTGRVAVSREICQ